MFKSKQTSGWDVLNWGMQLPCCFNLCNAKKKIQLLSSASCTWGFNNGVDYTFNMGWMGFVQEL